MERSVRIPIGHTHLRGAMVMFQSNIDIRTSDILFHTLRENIAANKHDACIVIILLIKDVISELSPNSKIFEIHQMQ